MAAIDRLALGTVQFGLPYGIASQRVQAGSNEAREILQYASQVGMVTLDTAIAYGDSERRLGEIGVSGWQVVSKLPAVPDSCADVVGWVQESVCASLRRLRIPALHGLLLHHPQDLAAAWSDDLYRGLVAIKQQGLASKIGISVYGPRELEALWSRYPLDMVQAPFNILDRQLDSSGWLARLHLAGTEVHVRSVFLQGLLLMPPEKRPAPFRRWQRLWDLWGHWLEDVSLTPLEACLGFAFSRPEIDRVVIGVDNIGHLREIIASCARRVPMPPIDLASEDADLINPSRWKAL